MKQVRGTKLPYCAAKPFAEIYGCLCPVLQSEPLTPAGFGSAAKSSGELGSIMQASESDLRFATSGSSEESIADSVRRLCDEQRQATSRIEQVKLESIA